MIPIWGTRKLFFLGIATLILFELTAALLDVCAFEIDLVQAGISFSYSTSLLPIGIAAVDTATPVPTDTSTPAPTAAGLDIYRAVAEEAINAAKYSMTIISAVLTAIAALSLAGLGVGGFLLQRTVSDISRKATEAEDKSQKATEAVSSANTEIKELSDQAKDITEHLGRMLKEAEARAEQAHDKARNAESGAAKSLKIAKKVREELKGTQTQAKEMIEEMRQNWEQFHKKADLGFYMVQAKGSDPETRLRALQHLAQQPVEEGLSEEIRPYFLDALRDVDYSVRGEAAYGLGRLKSTKSTVEALIEASKDREAHVRRECARSLGSIGKASLQAIQRLEEMAEHDIDGNVKQTATKALEKSIIDKFDEE